MKGKRGMIGFTVPWLWFAVGAAQPEMQRADVEVTPFFFFDAMAYSSDQKNKSRVDFYVQVPYRELRFVKEGDRYVARYDVTLTIATPELRVVKEQMWSVDVPLTDPDQTTSGKLYSLTQRTEHLTPGTYQLTVQVKDQDSRKTGKVNRSLLVTDFTKDSLSLSDIMLVSKVSNDGETKRIVPNVSGNVGNSEDGFFVFFEIYEITSSDTVDLTWRVFNGAKEEVKRGEQKQALTGRMTQAFLRIHDLKVPVGLYLMTIEGFRGGKTDSTASRATTSRSFAVRWTDIPASVTDLDKAIDQLRYIAKPSELDHMRENVPLDEKRKRFLDFWSKRDADPSTPRNELMEEYYQRVEYVNKNFSHYVEGWKTDRGMVYIRFGPPDNVERHPFEMNSKPYEVWYYYQFERQFVFVDETGFGDYRLRYPTTDLWGRVR